MVTVPIPRDVDGIERRLGSPRRTEIAALSETAQAGPDAGCSLPTDAAPVEALR